MASKSDILNNLREYSSDQIAEAINAGVVTMYELSKSGNLTPLMRRRIEEKLAAKQSVDAQTVPEAVPSTPEVASTIDEEPPSVDASNSDYEEDIIIPEAPQIDIPTEIDTPQVPVITETATPIFEAESNEITNVEEYSSISNKGMFKRPFSFQGRIRRLEYGISMIMYFVWYIIIEAMMSVPAPSLGACLFVIISVIPMIWFMWAQSAKRCHDRGNSGWYQIIPFYFLILLFGDGDQGDNEYGNNPKE